MHPATLFQQNYVRTHTKKRNLLLQSAYKTTKAGLHYCRSANRGSRIAFTTEQTTLKPTPYVHTRTYTRVHKYIPQGILCCDVLVA